jgi:hypothetical protein
MFLQTTHLSHNHSPRECGKNMLCWAADVKRRNFELPNFQYQQHHILVRRYADHNLMHSDLKADRHQ